MHKARASQGELGHPRELSPWCHLDDGLDSTFQDLQEAEWDKEIRNEATWFLNNVSAL